MPQYSIPFRFSQRFKAPAQEVYAWATDYAPDDIVAMGGTGRRKVIQVCNETLILADTYTLASGAKLTKKKLVRLDPKKMRWTNTHITGPNVHSQFWYELVPLGEDACRLDFTGMQIFELPSASRKDLAAKARQVKKEDSQSWKNLAKAFAADRKQKAKR